MIIRKNNTKICRKEITQQHRYTNEYYSKVLSQLILRRLAVERKRFAAFNIDRAVELFGSIASISKASVWSATGEEHRAVSSSGVNCQTILANVRLRVANKC
jgi:hypothetical protein